MKLTIDNLDGNGAIDYSGTLSATQPIAIERKLNEPSICTFALVISGTSLIAPLRNGRVIVTDNAGVVLFTGYLATEPARELSGAGTTGPIYQLSATAVSDEVLLDWQTVPQTRAGGGETVGQLLTTLTARVDATRLAVRASAATAPVGYFMPDAGLSWSQNAGALASMARASYFALAGAVNLAPIGNRTHALSETAGTLQVSALQASMVKTIAMRMMSRYAGPRRRPLMSLRFFKATAPQRSSL